MEKDSNIVDQVNISLYTISAISGTDVPLASSLSQQTVDCGQPLSMEETSGENSVINQQPSTG